MIRLFKSLITSSLVIVMISGCSDEIEKTTLTDEEKQKVIHIQNPFTDPVIKLSPVNSETPLVFGIQSCKVYEAKVIQGVIVEWELIIKPDFYPFGHRCTRQKMHLLKDDELFVETCTQAFGAGGGCITSGKYRTTDGIHWERESDSGEWEVYNKHNHSE
ncbi:hypothetical protein [Shewanella gelidii]|uniref:Lipoprotein n=1 Tax=Shewanella gelidii TaxID=1642821 RepID=A0A917JTS9_9GAMM|nr:hypothetical protein [Shewanella gelidii]MCL1098032.1 hypothetical protein [Shewanella gelidii]GGI85586.1 hypothetical protein GCM10009332_23640 [Shewanella gelidii]